MIIIIFIAWYLTGIYSFWFWWAMELKLIPPDLYESLLMGLLGPIAWILGYLAHYKRTNINFFGRKIK